MKIYDSVKINDNSYYINDEDHDSCYLIIGDNQALLIDLGLFKEPLLPTIKQLTDKDIIVACTHGHLDHVGAMKEFDNIYLSHDDKNIYFDNAKLVENFPLIDFNQIKPLQPFQTFDLGNIIIEAIPLPGHTPGSVIFLDRFNRCLYTGDAIGSGCGVWMQLYHSTSLIPYQRILKETITYLEKQGVDNTWKFWGGHNLQATQSKVGPYNKLDLQLMKDLEQLCLKLINKEITGIKNAAPTYNGNQAYYASYNKAEIIYQENSLKWNFRISLSFFNSH